MTFGAVIHRSDFPCALSATFLRIDFGGCRGPQPLAGKQVTRLPLRGHGLSHRAPDRAFVAPTGGTRGPRMSFARPCGASPPGPGSPEPRIPAPILPRGPLLATPSAASYSRPASRAKGAPRHGPSAIGSMHSRVQRPWAREPHILRDAFAKHPSRTTTAFTCSRNCWGTATPAHHELHAGPEPQARHRPEHGRLEFGP